MLMGSLTWTFAVYIIHSHVIKARLLKEKAYDGDADHKLVG